LSQTEAHRTQHDNKRSIEQVGNLFNFEFHLVICLVRTSSDAPEHRTNLRNRRNLM